MINELIFDEIDAELDSYTVTTLESLSRHELNEQEVETRWEERFKNLLRVGKALSLVGSANHASRLYRLAAELALTNDDSRAAATCYELVSEQYRLSGQPLLGIDNLKMAIGLYRGLVGYRATISLMEMKQWILQLKNNDFDRQELGQWLRESHVGNLPTDFAHSRRFYVEARQLLLGLGEPRLAYLALVATHKVDLSQMWRDKSALHGRAFRAKLSIIRRIFVNLIWRLAALLVYRPSILLTAGLVIVVAYAMLYHCLEAAINKDTQTSLEFIEALAFSAFIFVGRNHASATTSGLDGTILFFSESVLSLLFVGLALASLIRWIMNR